MTTGANPGPAGEAKVRRRLPAASRRERMLDAAAEHFAANGFASSTREIAAALGVTQALIYKHFASKEDLVEKMLARHLAPAEGAAPWIDPARPLDETLPAYYRDFVARASELRMQLFVRAGLDGRSWPTRRGHALTAGLFLPVIAALRRTAGLPGLDTRPAMRGERELVMMLHGAMVFLGIRRHVYRMPMPERLDDIVELYVGTFLRGAPAAMADLHAGGDPGLTVTLAADPG